MEITKDGKDLLKVYSDTKKVLKYAEKIAIFEKHDMIELPDIAEAGYYANNCDTNVTLHSFTRFFDSELAIIERKQKIGIPIDMHFYLLLQGIRSILEKMDNESSRLLREVLCCYGFTDTTGKIQLNMLHKIHYILSTILEEKIDTTVIAPYLIKLMEIA
jgi:hypothetical protein